MSQPSATQTQNRPIPSSIGPRVLTLKDQIKLVVLVEKDEALLNYITLIPVNPKKFR